MNYTPTEWKSGDTVTSAKLNKIEQGISAANSSDSGVFKVNITSNEEGTALVMDKTWNEIFNSEGIGYAYLSTEDETTERRICLISAIFQQEDFFTGDITFVVQLSVLITGETMSFLASSADGYPTASDSDGSVDPPHFSDMTEGGPS